MFWGIATVSVVAGQLYVGSGYRAYANALLRIFESIELEFTGPNTNPYQFMSSNDN